MTRPKTVLGRGLASLIPRQPAAPQPSGRPDDGVSNEIIASIDIERIGSNPYQPRADFDPVTLDELKRSIEEKGIIQPVTVRRIDHGYQLISGERRVRAARLAGLQKIPAYIIRIRSDEEMLELALIENLQRERLNPIEIAISYKRLIDECKMTQEQVSQTIGKDRTTITNFLRLLRLPEPIQIAVRKGQLTSGHARALVAIEDNQLQSSIFRKILSHSLSVRDVERLVRDGGRKKTRRLVVPQRAAGSTLETIEERLRQFLGTRVQIRALHDGKGEIIIEYYSDSDLERLVEILAGLEDRSR